MQLCDANDPGKVCFEKLAQCKNIVMLTKSAVDDTLQWTFNHTILGIPIDKSTLKFVARCRTMGNIVVLNPDKVFQTSNQAAPLLLDMMKLSSEQEVRDLTGQNNRQIPAFATLPPDLALFIIWLQDLSPANVLLEVICQIKANAQLSTHTNTPTQEASDDTPTQEDSDETTGEDGPADDSQDDSTSQ